ncbi:MAG: ferric reductase-like transmembrane domain-containing protein [Anaerolineales bacterium]
MKVWLRHLWAILLLTFLMWLFFTGFEDDFHPLHRWNRTAADSAFVLLCLTLIIGPAARFNRKLSFLLLWRRELGIAFVVASFLHVLVYTAGRKWDLLIFFRNVENGQSVFLKNAYATSNYVGLIALLYTIVLGITSNDVSQRLLGKGWKFLQQQTYTLFILIVIHTAVFLYLVFPEIAGKIAPVFWIFTFLAAGLQLGGYMRTVHKQSKRRKARRRL